MSRRRSPRVQDFSAAARWDRIALMTPAFARSDIPSGNLADFIQGLYSPSRFLFRGGHRLIGSRGQSEVRREARSIFL